MTDNKFDSPLKAYQNKKFLDAREARSLRILSEYLEPESRFARHRIYDTIVFMGSARFISREQAQAELEEAQKSGDARAINSSRLRLEMSQYYEAAGELAARLTGWSKQLNNGDRHNGGHRFVVCTGGGPGIMEGANRGASQARGLNIGMAISIPPEESVNHFVTRELSFQFHYFFMRKFWFVYLAKAVIFFPGGFGTLDELFELLTLLKTNRISKRLPVVLFGTEFWKEVVNFEALVRYGTIDPQDLELFFATDSVDEAFNHLTKELSEYAVAEKGASL